MDCNDKLWSSYQNDQSPHNLNELTKVYVPLVYYVFHKRFSHRYANEEHDFISHGNQGLVRAIESWHKYPEKQFLQFASACIFRSMNSIRRHVDYVRTLKCVDWSLVDPKLICWEDQQPADKENVKDVLRRVFDGKDELRRIMMANKKGVSYEQILPSTPYKSVSSLKQTVSEAVKGLRKQWKIDYCGNDILLTRRRKTSMT